MPNNLSPEDRKLFYSESYIFAFFCELQHSPLHNHDFFELVYVAKGTSKHITGSEERLISAGDYMFMDYSVSHRYDAVSDDFAVMNCLFLSKAIDKTMPECKDFMDLLKSYQFRLNKLLLGNNPANRFFHDDNGEVGKLLTVMCQECLERNTGYTDYMKCLLMQIIILTVRNISDRQEMNYSGVINRVIGIIEEKYSSKLTVNSIASELYLSVPYLSTRFRNETGMCISEYIKQMRIRKACMLLGSTDMKTRTVAESVGYNDYKRFGKVFRESTGISPGKYRSSFRDSKKL